jgi:hypothetical protein
LEAVGVEPPAQIGEYTQVSMLYSFNDASAKLICDLRTHACCSSGEKALITAARKFAH